MPRADNLHLRVGALTADLRPKTSRQKKALARLEKRLARALLAADRQSHVAAALSVERADWYGTDALGPERRRRLRDIADAVEPESSPAERVFRREVPLTAHGFQVTAPAWGRGAAIERSLGPFAGLDGRQFWFDFYPIVRLVPIYLPGGSEPALLVYLAQLGLEPGDPLPVSRALELLRSERYRLAGGSIWVRADLFSSDAPPGAYVGLRIASGLLTCNPPPVESDGKIVLPPGGQCVVELKLRPVEVAETARPGAGVDARESELEPPESFSFRLDPVGVTVLSLSSARGKAYGQELGFTWDDEQAPSFEPLLQSVLVPCAASIGDLTIGEAGSPLARPAGEAAIRGSAWALPVALIDPVHPTEAEGAGNLAVRLGEGLTLDWRGLRDGPVSLPDPWIVLAPGLISIVEPTAGGRYAHQRFRLWKDADSAHRSQLRLRYGESFFVAYASGATGTELLLAQNDAEARLDRPVDATGLPLPVSTLDSLLLLSHTDDQQLVHFYDDNILTDSLDPDASWPVEAGRAAALAIRNALFTITPVNSLLLFAELEDEETVGRGAVLVAMGLYGILPTLPDPYAANVSWLRRQLWSDRKVRRPKLLLVASNLWEKAASEEQPDDVTTRFAFAPLGTGEGALAAWSGAAAGRRAAGAGAGAANGTGRQRGNEQEWERVYRRFLAEQFALLDVSTRADQMGVSFAWFQPRPAGASGDLLFYEVYRPRGRDQAESSPYPLQVRGMDLASEGRFVRAFTTPQISWEPLWNTGSPPGSGYDPPANFQIESDPPEGPNFYPDDGGPTRLLNNSVELVPIAPIPVTELLVRNFEEAEDGLAGAFFTLPWGLRAFAELRRENEFDEALPAAGLGFNRPEYRDQSLKGGLQLRADAPRHPSESPIFRGGTLQLDNVLNVAGGETGACTLGRSVGTIFNMEFFRQAGTGNQQRGVPLTRIDFCGYGASTFSDWRNPNAALASTSQARFDVFVGRTSYEVVQVRSKLFCFGVDVVRTITLDRKSSANPFRADSCWVPESDGLYDFRYMPYDSGHKPLGSPQDPGYEFHPGIVRGVTRVRNIRDTNEVPMFVATWQRAPGEGYVDVEGVWHENPANPPDASVIMQPVYFDADVLIEDVISGAADAEIPVALQGQGVRPVPSRGMLGYVQLAPRGQPPPPGLLAELLQQQFGSLGGPVDCVVDIGGSGQKMRISRVGVDLSEDKDGDPIFVCAARGSLVLSRDGSWSVVRHDWSTDEVSPLSDHVTVPLIRRGVLDPGSQTTDAAAGDYLRVANPLDLVKPSDDRTRHYGLLQSTGTQKVLFRQPSYQVGIAELKGPEPPVFADAYRLLDSAGIFPAVGLAAPLPSLANEPVTISAKGYQQKQFDHGMPADAIFLINEEDLKIYVEYDGPLTFGLGAADGNANQSWLSKLDEVRMVVDLGPLTRLMTIRGKFDAEKGALPSFKEPVLEFSPVLQVVIDILQVLESMEKGEYGNAFGRGLEIAMSNSADSWQYAFHARKEIPLVRFPLGPLFNDPNQPLKLEAGLALGVYFNEVFDLTGSPGQLVPSAGAFIEFFGRLSVMAASVSVGTVYATGSAELRLAADVKTGTSLMMKFGFGATVNVGLPVVGTVALLYMVGIEVEVDAGKVVVGAFMLFRGTVEILGGVVTVTIQIEASGKVQRQLSGRTDLIAQVTFGLDISIFLVINISFCESWQEQRQIA